MYACIICLVRTISLLLMMMLFNVASDDDHGYDDGVVNLYGDDSTST